MTIAKSRFEEWLGSFAVTPEEIAQAASELEDLSESPDSWELLISIGGDHFGHFEGECCSWVEYHSGIF